MLHESSLCTSSEFLLHTLVLIFFYRNTNMRLVVVPRFTLKLLDTDFQVSVVFVKCLIKFLSVSVRCLAPFS